MNTEARPGPITTPLVAAAAWASAAAVAGREAGLLGLAACAAAALAWAAVHGRTTPLVVTLAAGAGAVDPPGHPLEWPGAGPVWLDGRVAGRVDLDPHRDTTTFRIEGRAAAILCVVDGALDVLPGDHVTGPGECPAQWDRRRRTAMPVVRASSAGLAVRPGPWSAARAATRCRLAMQRALLATIGGDRGRLLCHLVLGSGPRLDDAVVRAHSAAGLTHLLAVSGAHASMLAWLLGIAYGSATGRRAWNSRGYRWFCAVTLAAYGWITGWEPPVMRALLAYGVALWGSARGRRVPVTTALAAPALGTAMIAPTDVGSASFCLSYAAVVGLALAGAFAPQRGLAARVRATIRASAWAVITTAPLTLVYFSQLAPWTILATPLLAPLVAAMLAGGLAIGVVGAWSPTAAAPIAALVRPATWSYVLGVESFAALPGAPVPALSLAAAPTLAAIGLAGAVAVLRHPGRATVAAACAALCVPFFVPDAAGRGPTVELLPVGHGQACVVRLPTATMLVDCGSLGRPRRASRAVEDALARRRLVDVAILSHDDVDHVGGIQHLVGRVPIRLAILPAHLAPSHLARRLRRAGVRVVAVAPGTAVVVAPGVRVFAPAPTSSDQNELSLWVDADLDGFRLLTTGDAGPHAMSWMVDRLGRADVVVLPHHGRGDGQATRSLLAAVRPRLALVSNRAGEDLTPLEEVARSMGIGTLSTGTRGTITIRGGNAPTVACELPRPLSR